MKSEVMSHAGLEIWPLIAMIIFFLMIIAVGVWIFRRGSNKKYEHMSQMILKEDEPVQEDKDGRSSK